MKRIIQIARPLILCSILLFSAGEVCSQKGKKKRTQLSEAERVVFIGDFMAGQKQKMIDNPEKAIKYFQKALKTDPSSAAVKYEIARIYFEDQKLDDCKDLMLQAVKSEPTSEWYNSLLAQTFTAQNKMSEALKIYEKILKDHPEKKEYLFELANINLYLRNYKEALSNFDEIEKNFGQNEEIAREKLSLYDQLGMKKEAIEMLENMANNEPGNPFYAAMLAEYYQRNGQGEKGLKRFHDLLEKDPTNGMAHLSIYEYHLNSGDKQKASAHLKKAMESSELNIDIKMNILLNYFTITEIDKSLLPEAMELVDILLERHPDEAKSHAISGDFLMREGRIEEAKTEFLKAVILAPDRAAIWSQILAIDFEQGEFAEMVKHTEECLELFPTNPEFYYFNGLALNRLSNFDKAIPVLLSGKELVFDDPVLKTDFLTLLGESYNYNKDHKNSDKSFEQALNIQSENALILNNYSYYLSLRGDKLDRAREMIEKALNIVPGNPSYLDTYAWVLFKSGEYTEAEAQIKMAIAKGGSSSGAVLEHYGDILFKLGEESEAIEQWKIALSLGDTSEVLEKKLKDEQYYD